MALYQNIGAELECPICKDYFKVPKVMGRCLHVACLECLQQLVASRRSVFPCPVCREKCLIPTQGVAALKDDFRIRAIVEKYQSLEKDTNVIRCIACSMPASHCCKQCENSYICKECSKKHSMDPLTSAHELIGICSKHCKSLTLYCRKCNTAICAACLIVDHPSSSQEHDVVPHQQVAGEEVAEVASAVEKLEKTKGRKENALCNIISICDSVVATIDSDLSLLGKLSDSVMERSNKTRADLKAEKGSIEKQIEALMKREQAVDETIVATDKKITSDLQKKKRYFDYLNNYRSARMEEFYEAATQVFAETDEIKANVDLSRKETSTKKVFDDQVVPTLLKIKEGLRQTLTSAEQVDRAAQFVDAKEKLPRFVPAFDDTEVGFIRREYAALKKIADFSFPSSSLCKFMGGLKHIPNGRLICLYGTKDYRNFQGLGDTIMLHDDGSAFPAASPVLMDRYVSAPVAMTVTSKGEQMVLDNSKIVRIFNNDGYRDIRLNLSHSDSSCFTSFECDDEDNMFVGLSDYSRTSNPPAGSFCVFNLDGIRITEISETCLHGVRLMKFCRLRRIIYLLLPHNVILRYHWDGTTVKKMQSIRLTRVHGFECDDVCTDLGALFVAGHDWDDVVHIYQVKQTGPPIRQMGNDLSSTHGEKRGYCDPFGSEDERIECSMIELSFEDKVRRLAKMRRGLVPVKAIVMSISGDTLALGYDNHLELFHLPL